MVSPGYLETLVNIANTRFAESRDDQEAVLVVWERCCGEEGGLGRPEGWEDGGERKVRKRAGLEGAKGVEAGVARLIPRCCWCAGQSRDVTISNALKTGLWVAWRGCSCCSYRGCDVSMRC